MSTDSVLLKVNAFDFHALNGETEWTFTFFEHNKNTGVGFQDQWFSQINFSPIDYPFTL